MLQNVTETPSLALRSREAAKALGISERTLWQLKADGQIPFVQVQRGGLVLYPVSGLSEWLESRTTRSIEGPDPGGRALDNHSQVMDNTVRSEQQE